MYIRHKYGIHRRDYPQYTTHLYSYGQPYLYAEYIPIPKSHIRSWPTLDILYCEAAGYKSTMKRRNLFHLSQSNLILIRNNTNWSWTHLVQYCRPSIVPIRFSSKHSSSSMVQPSKLSMWLISLSAKDARRRFGNCDRFCSKNHDVE